MTIVVTGATGHLGRLAVEALLEHGVPAGRIVATGRSVDKIADLGVDVRKADYNSPEELRAAFEGAERVLFVSSSDPGQRLAQHQNVIEALKATAGIQLVAYTSIPKATTTDVLLAADHKATEELLAASGLPYLLLRNSWYLENYDLAGAVEHGLLGASGDGKVSIATRQDYAEAAANAVRVGEVGRVYELGGPGITKTEFAALISEASGTPVAYTNVSEAELRDFLVKVGLPEGFAAILADVDRATVHGALEVDKADLEALLGRPVTPLADAIRATLKQ